MHPAQPNQRHHLVANFENFLSVDHVDFAFARAQDLQHIAQGYGVEALRDAEEQGLDDGQGERHLEQEGGALAGKAAHADGALEAVHDRLDDIHADAASADLGDFAGGAQAGLEDEIEGVAVADPGGLLGAEDGLGDSLLDDHREIDAVAVIADLDDHLVALVIGIEADGSFGRFTGGSALQRRLNPVIDGVAQQVHHGLGQSVQNALVEIGILALDDDVDLAAGLFGGVTHDPGQAAEHLLDGYHANLHYGALKFSAESATGRRERRRSWRAADCWRSCDSSP